MIHYFDNAATTQVDEEILCKSNEYNTQMYFNPSSLHKFSTMVGTDIYNARNDIAKILGCDSTELYFTSGGSESDNTAILGALSRHAGNIVTTNVEHSAVYNTILQLKNRGYEVRHADVNINGKVDVDTFASKIDENTVIVSIMHVNNETGAINDIEKLCAIAKKINPKVIFVCDGVQAVGKIPVNLSKLGVDAYSFSGHKIHAPKGIGGLYVKKGVNITPLIRGGGQENGFRSGTENVAGIIALSLAIKKAYQLLAENDKNYNRYKEILIDAFDKLGDYAKISTNKDDCSPAILTVAFEGIKSQVLLNILEQENIIIGLGSACNSRNKTNRIMGNIGLDKRFVEGVVRIAFSKYNNTDEVEKLAETMTKNINYLRTLMRKK